MKLEVSDMSFCYEKTKEMVLKGVNLAIEPKGLTAVVGSNGSGKTTLGKLMAGILKPTEGHVLIDGISSESISLGSIGKRIGYLFQEPDRQIFAPTVEEELSFVLRLKGIREEIIEERVRNMLCQFHLELLRKSFPFRLSRGEKQRLALAALLINKPEFLILDEPTTALDIKRKAELKDLLWELKEQGVGILMISHDRKFVDALADRTLTVQDGGIVYDSH